MESLGSQVMNILIMPRRIEVRTQIVILRIIICRDYDMERWLTVLCLFLWCCNVTEEWIVKGEEIVQQMLEKVPKKEDSPESVEDEAKEAAP